MIGCVRKYNRIRSGGKRAFRAGNYRAYRFRIAAMVGHVAGVVSRIGRRQRRELKRTVGLQGDLQVRQLFYRIVA